MRAGGWTADRCAMCVPRTSDSGPAQFKPVYPSPSSPFLSNMGPEVALIVTSWSSERATWVWIKFWTGGEIWFRRYSDVSRGSVLAPCGLNGTKASLSCGLRACICIGDITRSQPVYWYYFVSKLFYVCLFFLWNQQISCLLCDVILLACNWKLPHIQCTDMTKLKSLFAILRTRQKM
jgi:hypothetical protein